MEEWVQASVEEGLFGCGQGIGMEEEFGKGEEGFVNGEVVGSKNPASPRNFCCAAPEMREIHTNPQHLRKS